MAPFFSFEEVKVEHLPFEDDTTIRANAQLIILIFCQRNCQSIIFISIFHWVLIELLQSGSLTPELRSQWKTT